MLFFKKNPSAVITPAQAYYNQCKQLAEASPRLRQLRTAINDPITLSQAQWAQWFCYILEFQPDLILELGRAKGNSTALACEALYRLKKGKIISLCRTNYWTTISVPQLKKFVEDDWFERLECHTCDIINADYHSLLAYSKRILVLWDAHGFDVAEVLLGTILPILQNKTHFVIMHDVSDIRYSRNGDLRYGDTTLWKGQQSVFKEKKTDCKIILGWIETSVDQTISALDFLTRNNSQLNSADYSFHEEIGRSKRKLKKMQQTIPAQDLSLIGHWAYFTLNAIRPPYTFPKVDRTTN